MRALLVLAAVLLLAAPARAVDPAIEDGSARSELNRARERWAARDLDDYRFRQYISCACLPPEVTEARTMRVRDGRALRPARYHRRYATVPKLFAIVRRAIERRVLKLDVSYGASGLPRYIFVDYDKSADEELTVHAGRLRPLR